MGFVLFRRKNNRIFSSRLGLWEISVLYYIHLRINGSRAKKYGWFDTNTIQYKRVIYLPRWPPSNSDFLKNGNISTGFENTIQHKEQKKFSMLIGTHVQQNRLVQARVMALELYIMSLFKCHNGLFLIIKWFFTVFQCQMMTKTTLPIYITNAIAISYILTELSFFQDGGRQINYNKKRQI